MWCTGCEVFGVFAPGIYVCWMQGTKLQSDLLPPPWTLTGLPVLPVVITAILSPEGLVTWNSNNTAINLWVGVTMVMRMQEMTYVTCCGLCVDLFVCLIPDSSTFLSCQPFSLQLLVWCKWSSCLWIHCASDCMHFGECVSARDAAAAVVLASECTSCTDWWNSVIAGTDLTAYDNYSSSFTYEICSFSSVQYIVKLWCCTVYQLMLWSLTHVRFIKYLLDILCWFAVWVCVRRGSGVERTFL